MRSPEKAESDMGRLSERHNYLEELQRETLEILETASTLGDFQTSINNLQDPSLILKETRARIRCLVPFDGMAFYLVNEETHDFVMHFLDPEGFRSEIQNTVEHFIEQGIFSWVLNQRRPVILPSAHTERHLIMHTMATCSRVRGMFVGILSDNKGPVPDIRKSLLSVILLNSSNAIESFELYHRIREINKVLVTHENYRALFEAAPDGVEVLDGRGHVIDCNRSQEGLLLRDRGSIVGCHTSVFLSESCRDNFTRDFLALRESGFWEGEVEIDRPDGSTLQIWRKGTILHNENRKFLGAIINNRDITPLKKMEKDRKDLEIRLQRAQKMEALGTLAGGIAHDLNNILSGIVSYPELLLMQLPEDSPFRKPLLTIQKSGEKAAATVQDMLTLARRAHAPSEIVDLNVVIQDYLRSPEHGKLEEFYPGVRLNVALDPALRSILGSLVHLTKIVMNLVSNAFEAMPGGGVLSISTKNRILNNPYKGYEFVQEGHYVTLSVSDTGTGMNNEVRERIFEPFYTKKSMGRSGSGLGMAVVWGALKDHNGCIDLTSTVGKGSVFTLFFPVAPHNAARAPVHSHPFIPPGNKEHILIVDDVEEQREIAAAMLAGLDYTVSSVSSGMEAIEHIRSRPADLVILDMILGSGMDGLETYGKILEISPGQKAIIASGFSESNRVREGLKLGAGTYIRKPYSMEAIGLAVHQELHKGR